MVTKRQGSSKRRAVSGSQSHSTGVRWRTGEHAVPTIEASIARAERERAAAEERGDQVAVHLYELAILALRQERDAEAPVPEQAGPSALS